ncbi:MAG TPA: hypothetical protein ENG42_00690 [Candidatus Aenigmarchaeota archaeon]|nr:hypothetical protein [Candidatus Aenigmarchaeota archaeon]
MWRGDKDSWEEMDEGKVSMESVTMRIKVSQNVVEIKMSGRGNKVFIRFSLDCKERCIETNNSTLNKILSDISYHGGFGLIVKAENNNDVYSIVSEMLGICIREVFDKRHRAGYSKVGNFVSSNGKGMVMFSLNIISQVPNEYMTIKMLGNKKALDSILWLFLNGLCKGIQSDVKLVLTGPTNYKLFSISIGKSIRQLFTGI